MKTVAMRKAAKAKANGNGKEKKPRKISRVSTPNKPNIKDFTSISKDSKGNLTKNTDWKAYERAQTNYRVRTKN